MLKRLLLLLIIVCATLGASFGYELSSPLGFNYRVITDSDLQWLQQQLPTQKTQTLRQVVLSYSSGLHGGEPFIGQGKPLPSAMGLPVISVFYKPLDLSQIEKSVAIEQSGQVVTLPKLQVDSLAKLDFEHQLKYWLSLDLKPLIAHVSRAQLATGWSDWELARLLQRYSSTVLTSDQQLPFLASFWYQAGYQIQIAAIESQRYLFFRLDRPVYNEPLAQTRDGYWFSLQGQWQGTISFPANLVRRGLALRTRPINDRSRSANRIFMPINISGKPKLSIELPAHWPYVARLPIALNQQFRQLLPSSLFGAIETRLNSRDPIDSTRNFAAWLSRDFNSSAQSLSIQQALAFKQMNDETRLVLMALWWRYLTQQPVALVRNESSISLALKLPATLSTSAAIAVRNNQWWLWNQSLKESESPISPSDQWTFLP